MAYQRYCKSCNQSIVMSQLPSGRWQPWEPDGNKRHQCGSSSNRLQVMRSTAMRPETYFTRCPWCTQHVFCHTNGYGDSVYFDQLGYPWQIHPCWESYWKHASNGNRLRNRIVARCRKTEVQLLLLEGIIQRISNIAQTSLRVYRIAENDLAERMGLTVDRLRADYGRLYKVVGPAELRIISDHRDAEPEPQPVAPKLKIIDKDPLPKPASVLPRVQCPRCENFVYECRLERHIEIMHERRRPPRVQDQGRRRQ